MNLPVEAKFVFSQDQDSCGDTGDSFQTLIVDIEDAGGGNYLILKTDRWAIDPDDIDAFCDRLKWCLRQRRSMFEEEEKQQPRDTPVNSPEKQSPPGITWEAFTARIEELKQLKEGWLDGGWLDWLTSCFTRYYSSDLPLPYLFPQPNDGLLMEWKIGPWSISVELNFKTEMADYNVLNLDTGRQIFGSFRTDSQGTFGKCVSDLIREYVRNPKCETTKSLADALRRIIEKAEATVATIKNCSGPPAPVTATEVAMELRDIAYSALKNDKNRAVLEDLQSHLSKK